MADELKLLSGQPIEAKDIGLVYPLKIKDIVDIGMDQYNYFLLTSTFDTQNSGINDWFKSSAESSEVSSLVCWALSLCFKDEVFFYGDYFRTKNDIVVTSENYHSLAEVIRKQYCLEQNSNAGEKYSDEKARKIGEKLKKFREQIKNNSNSKTSIAFTDMISGVCARHPSINLLNIWDLTIYQLYDQFRRLNLIDNYNSSIILLPHSEDAGKNLKHWSTNII